MCFPGGGDILLGIQVSQVGEHISLGICVSQVTVGKNIKVAGDSAGCRRILTTLPASVFNIIITHTKTQVWFNTGPGPRGTRKNKVKSITLPNNFDDDSSLFNFFP